MLFRSQRLARVLARLMPDEPEAHGLLALLELTAARFPARTAPDGEPVLLEQQDRHRWDQAAIRRGRAALARAVQAGRGLGAYGLQAAIAECHAVAPSVGATNWEEIAAFRQAWEAELDQFGRVDGYAGTQRRLAAPPLPNARLKPRSRG